MNKTLITLFSIVLVCVLVLSGCAAGSSPAASSAAASATQSPAAASSAAAPATSAAAASSSKSAQTIVTDMLGNQVTIQSTDKIVSLAPSTTETLYALDVGDRIIGVDSYSDYPAEAKSKTVVGDFNGPNVEKIVALKPDIVFCGNTLQKDQ
ncbi:MAG: ABC transporter substrate-binding protein, partial [Eubacteriales bacterium]